MVRVKSYRGILVLRGALLAAMGAPIAVGCSSDDSKMLPFECEGPEVDDTSGLVFCQTGESHRTEAKACDPDLYDPEAGPRWTAPAGSGCQKNGDCTEHPWGLCRQVRAMGVPTCVYGCLTNDDCDAGQKCLCTGDGPSTCVEATCETDADCSHGLPCLLLEKDHGSPCEQHLVLRCGAECVDNSDCGSGQMCRMSACVTSAICGRPFLVEGAARLACAATRNDWHVLVTPGSRALEPEVRTALAAHWKEVGLMEHASIAAFARFTLQLLAAGAPSSLVAAAGQALADETEHARLCFSIASAYAGRDIGPGPLPVESALSDQGFTGVVQTAFLEACVGETCAALEAAEAAEHATDPFIAASLRRIAADESRHAELGWKFVTWALGTVDCSSRKLLLQEFRHAAAVEGGSVTHHGSSDLTSHGVLSAAARAAVRRTAFVEVIAPCLGALERAHAAHDSASIRGSALLG